MRTDELAPRGSLIQTNTSQERKWPPFNPAYGALFLALVAGLFAESAFQSYQNGLPLREWWREVLSIGLFFGMAVVGVVRGLHRAL
jgi:hypothetical protein